MTDRRNKIKLYDWQTECLEIWEKNQCRGIINVVTGAGKTVLALVAAQKLEKAPGGERLKVKIIVPKTFLVYQWYYALNEMLGAARGDIGKYMGTHKSNSDQKYMIYVINSARYSFAKHMLDEIRARNRVFIIADECHHYGASENSKIFDFIKTAPDFTYFAMGLSATPYGRNYERILEPYIGREIYRFTFSQALKAEIISHFSVINVGMDFDQGERFEYDELSEKLGLSLFKLKEQCPNLYVSDSRRFFLELEKIISSHISRDVRQLAETVRFLMYRRKELIHLAKSRLQCVEDLVGRIDKKSKIIIFGERIETANAIYDRLSAIYPGESGIYHSELHESIRKTVIRNFEDSEIRILVSCKSLDEGLNIKDADAGIVMSSTSGERQRIQRLGRVLRKKGGGRRACFYYLYVRDTTEEADAYGDVNDGTDSGVNIIDLYYDEREAGFANAFYEELIEIALDDMKKKSWSERRIAEFMRNAHLGVVTCDWLMPEDECIIKIKGSKTRGERNYHISMLLLIRARRKWVADGHYNY